VDHVDRPKKAHAPDRRIRFLQPRELDKLIEAAPDDPLGAVEHRLARELELHFQRPAYRTDDDLVFCHPHTGNVLDPSKMRKRFGEAITRAGAREITFHELRHTFGTQMAAAGAPLRAIQEWMGHADAKTTEIYRHYAPDPTNGAQLVERAFSTAPAAIETETVLDEGRR
jgi:integrase